MIAIDLGSNTIRAVDMDCKTLEPIGSFEKIVKTADGMYQSGKISDEATERIIEALKEAKRRLDFSKPLVAVATQAMRKASNATAVLEKIAKETGVNFRIISGIKEADFTLMAVRNRLEKLHIKTDSFVMADIGGGSTEILFFDSGNIRRASFPVGIVTVAQKYGSVENISKQLPSLMKDIYSFAQKVKKEGIVPESFISTAGTPTTVAAMKLGLRYENYDAGRVNGVVLTPQDLKIQMSTLMKLDKKARQKLVGVGREDLITAGILIFEKLYEILNFDESVVIDDGLREGVAIAACRFGLDHIKI